MRFLVFTDLDGTLLDHDTYAWDAAAPALERLRAEGMPLIFVTSKTRAEVEPLRKAIGNKDPFVVENGAGVFFPARFAAWRIDDASVMDGMRTVVLGRPYAQARDFMRSEGHGYGARGFGDMTDEEVGARTGLSVDDSRRARTRDFTEPFVLEDAGRLPGLRDAAARAGFSITTGGRFHHLIGEGQDKGEAVARVRDAFRWNEPGAWRTIGLGDGPNDVPMLERVDLPIVMPAPGRAPVRLEGGRGRLAPAPGPIGWTAALLQTLDEAHEG